MSYGILLVRLVVGGTMFGHGSQKAFGWFDGPGLGGVRGWLGGMGFRAPAVMALLVATAESSGLLLALGLVTPLAALGIASAMFVAIGSVHWKNGFWNGNKGFEFNLVLIAVAVGVAATGPGRFSLDRALHIDDNLSGLWWGVGVLVVALLGAAFVLAVLRRAPDAQPSA
ncbi:MAG TPA: DoxX family protein [Gaiellaceae bacterium]|nr:DoxX family protein [Gaiellaceae bacterium]